MPHVAFVDANLYGLSAVELALRLDCTVSFVHSKIYGPLYDSSEAYARIANRAERVLRITNPSSYQEVYAALREIHARQPLDAVIGMLDVVVESVADAANRLGIPFTSAAGVRRSRNKAACHRRLAESGLPAPLHTTVGDRGGLTAAAERIGYPLVIKPASGTGSLGCTVVHEPYELDAAWSRLQTALAAVEPSMRAAYCPEVIVEEHLAGALLSVEIAATRDGHLPLGILERKRGADETVELGSLAPARLDPATRDQVVDFAGQALTALELDLGVFHLEMILTRDGPRLIDPNLRMIGGPGALLIGGTWDFDAYRTLLAVHLGWRVEPHGLEPVRYGTTHLLAPAAGGVWRSKDPSWLDDVPEVSAWRVRVPAGAEVRPITSGFEYLGFVLVHAETRQASVDRCNEVVERLAAEASVPLLTWQP